LAEADDRTLVLAVVTGGASALLPAPATGIDLEALQSTTQALLDSGADIGAVNAVRKHLSELKGGGLARAAAPATVVSLVFSDVVGDRLDVIASGPTVPDRTTFDDALAVLDRYDVAVPESVRDRLHRGAGGDSAVPETPKPGDPVFDAVSVHVLASTTTGLAAARETAVERGYRTCLLSSRLRGEARATGTTLAAVAEEMLASGDPVEPPAVLLAGGESTVTIRGDGTGGPNGEVGVAFALEFDAAGADDRGPDGASDPVDALAGRVACLSADTDGIDGATDAAGALVDPRTAAGPDAVAAAREALADNDALPYLESRDAVVRTGPTGTNVNDVQFVVIEGDDDGAA
jgi:hydroxypyruvate reductase